MERVTLCKGGCGKRAIYKGWCNIKWKKGSRICVTCPELEKKRIKSISIYRIKEAELGLNPMQNPKICRKNHLQNLSEEAKMEFGKKISRILKRKFRNGEIKLNDWGKKYKYRSSRNGEINLRSKWERETAKFLDKYDFNWEYEDLAITYYDRERKLFRSTVPDFHIPAFNLFIEVKGNGEIKSQNTQDKLKGIRQQGYKIELFGKKQIKLLREDPLILLSELKELL